MAWSWNITITMTTTKYHTQLSSQRTFSSYLSFSLDAADTNVTFCLKVEVREWRWARTMKHPLSLLLVHFWLMTFCAELLFSRGLCFFVVCGGFYEDLDQIRCDIIFYFKRKLFIWVRLMLVFWALNWLCSFIRLLHWQCGNVTGRIIPGNVYVTWKNIFYLNCE